MAASMVSGEVLKQKIKYFVIISRLAVILLQIVFNAILPDHDAGAFNPGQQKHSTISDHIVSFLLGGFKRWDGIYYTHIAEHGYTYENTLAFFPLFPVVVRVTANTIMFPLQLLMSYGSVLLIAATVLNALLFLKTAENLYRLGKIVTCNDTVAYTATLLFCINPASVFMSAPYSECIYSYLTVTGLLKLEDGKKLSASVFFAFSCLTRSNGLLNLGYLVYTLSKKALQTLRQLSKAVMMNINVILTIPWIYFITTLVPYSVLMIISVLPFVMYQYYCFQLYCKKEYVLVIPEHLIQYARTEGLKLPSDESSPWCYSSFPLAYRYIQSHYWEQGLFRYWEIKQIPNFLLATPVTVLVFSLAVHYYRNNRYTCVTLGLDETGAAKKEMQRGPYFQLEGMRLLPYVIHAVMLTVFGWCFIHVQVLTRLLFSSTPVLYWYSAYLLLGDLPRQQQQFNKFDISKQSLPQVETMENLSKPWKNLVTNCITNFKQKHFVAKFIIVYFITYFVVGVALFSNFLPWT
ncbi:GPI mannosyltransferase 2-like [Mercenaria mercenaria]|uniref:GPI mannosyltransferase 2-like n=1 Tax=Mercenaria mercenaria TaxID=6596 RepID=UPI00234F0649|nr:GPI mannosyltransferase 2-like [Mercenaria mercenaria]